MSGYAGSAIQQELQAKSDALYGWIYSTPGICHQGRFIGTDDPERIGWETIFDFLERDGVFGFRMVPAEREAELRARIEARGCRIDFWDVFCAEPAAALAAARAIMARDRPAGVRELAMPQSAADPLAGRLQSFLLDNGIAPFSGSMLAGAFGPAVTLALADRTGELVAAAHAYYPHNAHSPYHRWVWCGLVAVAAAHRGRGLGRYVNARLVSAAVEQLAPERITELVAAGNVASRRMIEACGLRLEPSLKTAIAVAQGGRFTS